MADYPDWMMQPEGPAQEATQQPSLPEWTTKLTPEQQRAERLRKIALAYMKTVEGEPGRGDVFSHDFTFGLMRPVGAAGAALGGEMGEWLGGEPATFGERYRAEEGAYDDYLAEARQKPGSTAVGVAGSLLAGGPGRGAFSLPKAIAEGGVTSGVQSAAEAEGSLADRAKAGGVGALTGSAASAMLGGLASRFTDNVRVPDEVSRELRQGPHPDVLRTQANNLYKQLDDAGVAYDPGQAGSFLQNVEAELLQEGFNPRIQPKAAAVIDEFRDRVSGNQPISLTTLQQLRQQARAAAAAIEPEDRRIGSILIGQIDDFIRDSDPALSVGGMDRGQIAQVWQEARSKWRAMNITEDLLWKVSKADRRAASANSGANTENPLRQNIARTLDAAENPRRMNPYNEPEIAAMERVVRGTPVQNFLRATGNRLGGSGPLGMSGAGGGGLGAAGALYGFNLVDPQTAAAIGTAAAPILWGAGKAARTASSRMAEANIDDLIRLVSSEGMQSPRVQAIMQGPPTRARLALMQFLGRSTAGGGRVAAEEGSPPY